VVDSTVSCNKRNWLRVLGLGSIYPLLFHSSNSTLTFSLSVSCSECILANTVTSVMKPIKIGHKLPIVCTVSTAAHPYCFALLPRNANFSRSL
jgi:hypothetical protein